MSQNYVGLDGRIYYIVKKLLNGESVDLSNYYTKDEVDALIASGGGGTTIDYNSLTNKPIINYVLQNNLDCGAHDLTNINNIYTKTEVDQKIAEAGGGTTDYNRLTNKPIDNYVLQNNLDCGAHDLTNINNIYTKQDCDNKYQLKIGSSLNINSNSSFSENAANQNACLIVGGKDCWYNTNIVSARNTFMSVGGDSARVKFWDAYDWSWLAIGATGDATGEPYIYGRGVCALTIGPLRNGIDMKWRYTYDDEGNINGGSSDISIAGKQCWIPERDILNYDTESDSIVLSKNAVIPNIYTKTEVDQKIAEAGGGGGSTDNITCKTLSIVDTTGVNYKLSPVDGFLKLGSTVDDSIMLISEMGVNMFGNSEKMFRIIREGLYDKIMTGGDNLEISAFKNIALAGSDTDGRIVLSAKEIMFNGTLNNVYTKEEVDQKIAEAGGGGSTGNYKGPVINNIVESSSYGRAWILSYTQSTPIDKFGLLLTTNNDNANATGLIYDYARNTIGFGTLSSLADTPGLTYHTATDLLSVGKLTVLGNINAKFIAASEELTAPNIYTKTEVDQKIASGTGLLIKGTDTDGTPESINAEINKTPDGFAKMFKSNYGGAYQMQTIFTVKLDTSRIFSLMFPKGSNLFRFQTALNGTWYTIQSATSASQTITHEAPFVGDITEYTIGDPVFASGRVCKFDIINNVWLYQTGPTDCICEVKDSGTVDEYVGICVGFKEDTHSLIFATHGDYYFNVQDSSIYKTGDVVLLDGTILKDDTPITGKIMKMIVGKVTGKISKNTVAVLKD